MSVLLLRWRKAPPPIVTAWRGADARVTALAAAVPPGPVAAVIGPPGVAGAGASEIVTRIAGEALGGHRAIRVAADGTAHHASATDADVDATIGVTAGAAASGASAAIQVSGALTEPSWAWTPGPVWLGTNGLLTQSVPAAGASFRIGTAIAATTIIITPRLIARL